MKLGVPAGLVLLSSLLISASLKAHANRSRSSARCCKLLDLVVKGIPCCQIHLSATCRATPFNAEQ